MTHINDAAQATPAAELENQICNPNVPKNEREWWAAKEIGRLRRLIIDNALATARSGESILDREWDRAVEAAEKEVNDFILALRSANGDSENWVWSAANACEVDLAKRISALRRTPVLPPSHGAANEHA